LIKIYVDACFNTDTHRAYGGAVLITPDGIKEFQTSLETRKDSDSAEYKGILWAHNILREHNIWGDFRIYNDCQAAIHRLHWNKVVWVSRSHPHMLRADQLGRELEKDYRRKLFRDL